jgi:hypothetical protein
MFSEPKYWCSICEATGLVEEVYYQFENGVLLVKSKGNKKNCPGCDGTKISVRAQKERDKDNGRPST